ncbi:hypothetical protein PP707_05790, partial [Acetobacter pasteurianus]|nr:hypothetical protein [Acetobacter pasteurianus]
MHNSDVLTNLISSRRKVTFGVDWTSPFQDSLLSFISISPCAQEIPIWPTFKPHENNWFFDHATECILDTAIPKIFSPSLR